MYFKNIKKIFLESKALGLSQNVCNFQKENHTLEYGFKNL